MNQNKTNLTEQALRPNILKDLMHNIISIDEFKPKLNNDNIVVHFQVKDNYDAAYDLSAFIERSPENILDTEAVETPNKDGLYDVFCEFERNVEFPQKFINLVNDIKNLTSDVDWKLQMYQVNDPIDMDIKKITKNSRLEPINETSPIVEFFDYAPIKVQLTENKLVLTPYNDIDLIYESVSEIHDINELSKNDLKDYTLDNSRLSAVLGEGYTVMRKGLVYIIGNDKQYIMVS